MLLKSIKLENFRQFRNESIDFAQGEGGKNVTIIIGENGTGKTTFAQAFFWCLYGETEFSDKIILNKMVATEMTPGSEEKVRVTLALRHGEVDYTLIREQAYHKDYSNNVKGDNTVFDIAIKDASGNTSYVKKSQCEAEVKSILPKELSRYFFFDGERIEKMSKDISTGKKATDFAEAVKGLLGLNAMISAIGHFNPRSSLSVIGSYEKSFDSKSNTKIQEYTAKIDKCNVRLAEIDAALEDLDAQKAAAETRKSEKVIELKQYSEGEKLQKEKEELQKQIDNTTRMRATVYKTMCKDFNASMSPFFSLSLIKRALEVLSRHDYSGKDIPFIRDKTIEYLLRQKICLCGTHLDEGSVPYEKVKSLLDVIPPKSLSTYVTDFKKESKRRAGSLQDLVEQMKENLATASQQSDDIMDKIDELHKIDFLLCHYPEQQSVGLRYLPLANETLYLVMARSCYNRISEERPDVFDQIPWDELQSLPFYLTQSYYRDRQLIDLALKDMNLEPVHVQELCSYYSIFGLVENDLGVTIAPSVNCQPFLQNEKLVFIKIPWNNQAVDALYAVVQEGLPLSPSAQIVLDACTREFLSMNHE